MSKSKSKKAITVTYLHALAAKWQKKLRLLDWDIYIKFAIKDEPNFADEQLGRCATNTHRKIAHITVRHPDTYSDKILKEIEDFDQTVVHEMLHIPTALLRVGTEECDMENALYEQFVDQMAILLVTMDKAVK